MAPVLERFDCDAQMFEEAEPMWEALEERRPDLMIVDAESIADADRLEAFIDTLNEGQPPVPLVVLLSRWDEDARRRLFEAGADDYLVEPLLAGEVGARLSRLLAEQRRTADDETNREQATVDLQRASASFDAPLSVLVCDDESMIHRVLRASFERKGWFVSEALDGAQALEMVERDDFDVLVFDLSLPFKNGFELLEALRERVSDGRPRRLVLSAEQQPESVLRAFELGADDVVKKPVDPEVLTARIERLMRLLSTERVDG